MSIYANTQFTQQLENTGSFQDFQRRDRKRRAAMLRDLEKELLHVQQSTGAQIDRLEHQKHSLEKHLSDLERQIIGTGDKLAAVSETVYRMREATKKRVESLKARIKDLSPAVSYGGTKSVKMS